MLAPWIRWSPQLPAWGIFRVAQETVSLHVSESRRELATGDVVVWPSGAVGCFRGGKSRDARLQFFLVSLESLAGVLTWVERQNLLAIAGKERASIRCLTSAHAAAREFARIGDRYPTGSNPVLRCELLRLFADIFSSELASGCVNELSTMRAADRVERMLRQLPESAIMSHTITELARQCGCSERHFSRLFRDQCGVSVRARQVQLRLEMAGQLLRESNAKVIHVAMDSGYRHLGLFNTMFKRRFGMTPREWRQLHLVNNGSIRR